MAHNEDLSMAVFCDFENIALGVRDAQYEKFDIKPVLERLLLKGSIVVKKAYCDWERYKHYKAAMHEANFELIEIPHVRQSGKNSADIRLVVDALDLCYTKPHVNTFVIISGDSDFSPLVSKLRENAKRVIGVGVKQSTSDLLIANCDEFIYIDDLVRRRSREDRQAKKPVDPQELEARRAKGLEIAASTLEALLEDRADDEKVWASVLKEAIKRRHPGFNETYHGFKTFGALLEEAARRGLLEFGREANSAFVKRRSVSTMSEGSVMAAETGVTAVPPAPTPAEEDKTEPSPRPPAAQAPAPSGKRRRGRGRATTAREETGAHPEVLMPASVSPAVAPAAIDVASAGPAEPTSAVAPDAQEEPPSTSPPARRPRAPRRRKVET